MDAADESPKKRNYWFHVTWIACLLGSLALALPGMLAENPEDPHRYFRFIGTSQFLFCASMVTIFGIIRIVSFVTISPYNPKLVAWGAMLMASLVSGFFLLCVHRLEFLYRNNEDYLVAGVFFDLWMAGVLWLALVISSLKLWLLNRKSFRVFHSWLFVPFPLLVSAAPLLVAVIIKLSKLHG